MKRETKRFPLELTEMERIKLGELASSHGFETSAASFLRWIIRTMRKGKANSARM